MSFNQSSNLEVQTPPKVEEMALKTDVNFYFNISRSARGEAFMFYLGNVLGTHTKLPMTSTDDYMAVEVVQGGKCKLTMDMGAGSQYIYSNSPIAYDQWNQLEIERNGFVVEFFHVVRSSLLQ